MKTVGMLAKLYLKRDFIIKNWKTTLFGSLTGIATYVATVDWNNPAALKTSILPILMIIWGVVQKDGNVTGGNVPQ
jgi:hypothetical protein